MDIQTVRCKHCGNHYNLQLSGYGWWDYNADRSDDYCTECYAIIKNELNALEAKLKSKEIYIIFNNFNKFWNMTLEERVNEYVRRYDEYDCGNCRDTAERAYIQGDNDRHTIDVENALAWILENLAEATGYDSYDIECDFRNAMAK